MTLQSYLWGVRIGTIFSFVALCAVVFLTDPNDIGDIAFVLFYLTFFLTASGFGVLIFTKLWQKKARDVFTMGEVGMAVRQGVLLGLLATIIVFMQQIDVLVWWSVLLVVISVLLVELYFNTRE